MDTLKQSIKQINQGERLPFSVYSSHSTQKIFNVPVIKPTLICVLDGYKQIGSDPKVTCSAGEFVFLSNSPKIDMRNVPIDSEYLALIIEFDYDDFDNLKLPDNNESTFFTGEIDSTLTLTLRQFVEWSAATPIELWHLRRQEILNLLYHLGYCKVANAFVSVNTSQKLYQLIRNNPAADLKSDFLASKLAMSESTLRRKLSIEGTNIKIIKDNVRLDYGLHLLQTTRDSVGRISEQCGFLSQSRFTNKFKNAFGITPSELRKTRISV